MMKFVPSLVIFDLDGTLADSQEGILRSFRSTLDELDLHPSDERLKSLIGPPLEASFAELGIDDDDLERVVRRYREFYVDGVRYCRLYDGVVEMLEGLRAASVRLGVATSKRIDFAREMLDTLGIAHYFESVAGASVDGSVTLKIDIVGKVLDELRPTRRHDVWMVGDRDYDINAAIFHRLVPVGVLWGYGARGELVASGATVLVDDPRELLSLEEEFEGGDPVCWAHLLCPDCGVILSDGHEDHHCRVS